ncbi:MAG: hypothetical protein ACLFUJ_15565 [Phycisphaerae bacterium]
MQADLTGLIQRAEATTEVFEADYAGGGKTQLARLIETTDCDPACSPAGLKLTFHSPGAWFQAAPQAMNLPEDWQRFGRLALTLDKASSPVEVLVEVRGARCRLPLAHTVQPESLPATLEMDLADLALAAGTRELYKPSAIRIAAEFTTPGAVELTVSKLELIETDTAGGAVVDRFGQRRNTTWPLKVTDEAELIAHRDAEEPTLGKTWPYPADRFGGWTDGPKFAPGDFFRVEQDDGGRWWFVTPEGNPFWSIGTTCIRLGDVSPIGGREHLFEQLPDPAGPCAEALRSDRAGRTGISFYCWNILRKYGSHSAWQQRVLDRFITWGFNSAGNWCEPPFLNQQRIPHFRWGSGRDRRGDGAHAFASGRFPDVWDPAWETFLDGHFAELTAESRDNPWLVGYFVDNESPWKSMRLLEAPADGPIRSAWMDFCREHFDDLAACNAAMGTDCADFQAVGQLRDEQIPAEGPGREAMERFEGVYADRYASTINRILKKHDPNHLYLGCRFVNYRPHEHIVRGVGRHVDVMTVNCYSLYPPRDRYQEWHDLAGGKPLLIGEFHFPLQSQRQLPPLYRCYSPAERNEFYADYVRNFASMPFSLGCHWFQHADQPITGRASNGENQPIGFVDITDQPHEDLVSAARQVTRQLWQLHLQSE